MSNLPPDTPQHTPHADDQIPELAIRAMTAAFEEAIADGFPVLMSENGLLVEIQPDGSRRTIKPLPPRIPAVPGTVYQIR